MTSLTRPTSVLALLVPLVLGLLAAPGAIGPASAVAPTKVTVDDGVQQQVGWDIDRVTVTSAVQGGRDGVVRVVTARRPKVGQAYSVWFDLDRDRRPDAFLGAYPESEWFVSRARSWTRTGRDLGPSGCFDLDGLRRGYRITVDPHCLARPRTFRVAVLGFRYDPGTGEIERRDWAPAARTWSAPVRSFRAAG